MLKLASFGRFTLATRNQTKVDRAQQRFNTTRLASIHIVYKREPRDRHRSESAAATHFVLDKTA